MKRVTHDAFHRPIHQQVGVPPISRARNDLQIGKVALGDVDDSNDILRVVHRNDKQLRLLRTRGAQ